MSGGREARLQALKSQDEQRRLSKEDFLRPRIREEVVPIEGLGGTVVMRSVSHRRRVEMRNACGFRTDKWDEEKFAEMWIAETVVDPDISYEDIVALRDTDAMVWDELNTAVNLFDLGMGDGAKETKKDSKTTQS